MLFREVANARAVTSGVVAALLLGVGATACTGPDDDEAAPRRSTVQSPTEPSTPAPEPTPSSSAEAALESIFVDGRDFRYDDMPLPEDLRARLTRAFGRMRPIRIVAKRVESAAGEPVPVRVLAISYEMPERATLAHVAYEIGREFLDATPENSKEALGGRGVYMRPQSPGGTEAMAFFVGEELFVYAVGVSSSAPTEEVAKDLLRHAPRS